MICIQQNIKPGMGFNLSLLHMYKTKKLYLCMLCNTDHLMPKAPYTLSVFLQVFSSGLPKPCSARACLIAYKLKLLRFDLILDGFGKPEEKTRRKTDSVYGASGKQKCANRPNKKKRVNRPRCKNSASKGCIHKILDIHLVKH